MPRHVAQRPITATGAGAPTQTITDASPRESGSRHIGTLRLRGEPRQRRGVQWAADVVDNSNMGRKKSKVCCIYHKPHAVGESSSESDSSSSSSDADSDSEPDDGKARMGGKGAMKRKAKPEKLHDADHDGDCEHDHSHDGEDTPDSSASDDDDAGHDETGRSRARRGHVRRPSPNAYEKMKTYKTKKSGNGTVTITENPGT